jgi:hypothetical protein
MSESQTKPSRRGFMLGAAVAGAATAAVVALPRTEGQDAGPLAEKTPPAPANGGGYRVTEHVRQYYKSTLI